MSGISTSIRLPDKKYNIIYADPPWSYNDRLGMKGAHGFIRGAASFYSTMKITDIMAIPIHKICDNNCVLFLWVTMPLLREGLDTMKAWGFKYKTCAFTWVKKTKTGKNHFGMGHYTRGNAELCLLGIKGKLPILNHSISQIVEDLVRKHSKKPDIVRDKIVSLYGDLPKIELFARNKTPGWDVWGNEV